jgi:hypothetical protein
MPKSIAEFTRDEVIRRPVRFTSSDVVPVPVTADHFVALIPGSYICSFVPASDGDNSVYMDSVTDTNLTPSLLKFYRAKVDELQQEQNTRFLSRLKVVELTSQDRATLEKRLLEYEDDLDQAEQDLATLREAIVRERQAVIELVEENAQLRGDLNKNDTNFSRGRRNRYPSPRKVS